jgi:hypothetical protein
MRWGDSIAVRGAAASTQILLAPGGGANFGTVSLETNILALLSTSDGLTFTSTPIWITNAPVRFGALGIAFGPGANTCFVKNAYDKLYFIEFDPNSGLGWVKHASNLGAVPSCVTAIGTDSSKQLLGALSIETPDTFRLYNISNPLSDAELIDQAAFQTDNANTLGGGFGPAYGSVAFGSNFVYVLDSNNGVKALELRADYTAPDSFGITTIRPGTGPIAASISWLAAAGRTYQVLSKDVLSDSNGWQRVGMPVLGTATEVSVTNLHLISAPSQRFYRVVGQ